MKQWILNRVATGHSRRGQPRDQRGASLILALMFTTSIAFMLGVSLDFAAASFGQSNASTSLRNGQHAAEGAIHIMIHSMRRDITIGREGLTCSSVTLAVGDGRTVTTACVPEPGSGALLNQGSGAYANRAVAMTSSIAGVTYIRARVLFNDAGGAQPGKLVQIVEWSNAI